MNEVKGKCGKQILHVILSSPRLTIRVFINNFSSFPGTVLYVLWY